MEGSNRDTTMELSDAGGRGTRRGQCYVSGEAEDTVNIISLCRNLQLESAGHF